MGKSTFITQVCIQSLQEYGQDEGLYSFVLLCVCFWLGLVFVSVMQSNILIVQFKLNIGEESVKLFITVFLSEIQRKLMGFFPWNDFLEFGQWIIGVVHVAWN